MNCRKVNNLLSAYIDGELAGYEYRQIRDHLARCPECLDEYEGLLQTKRLLSRLRVQEAAPELPASILKRIETMDAAESVRGPFGWFDTVLKALRPSAPATQGMLLGGCLAVVGLFLISRTTEASDRIQWTPMDATKIAANPAMPEIPPLLESSALAPPVRVLNGNGQPRLRPVGVQDIRLETPPPSGSSAAHKHFPLPQR